MKDPDVASFAAVQTGYEGRRAWGLGDECD
jgi:hypothetical protein